MPPKVRRTILYLAGFVALLAYATPGRAQAALLMEEPYGFFGTLNPTGHTAIYFSRICAATPVKLRRCTAGETGVVIARYQGIAGYDWVAVPLIPYLYSVEDVADVPGRVNRETVLRLRKNYHEHHLGALGANVFEGNLVRGGWTQLVGVAYERRIFAFRFDTTEDQDDDLIALLNDSENHTRFNLLYDNCADFARGLMNFYFPKTFKRTIFPDLGMTTPRQITFRLVRYARKHPGSGLRVFEIPQVPGYRRMSHPNKSVAGSLITTGYAIPIAILNPYLAGGIFVDYLVRGRFPRIHEHPTVLDPAELSALGKSSLEGAPTRAAGGELQPKPGDDGAQPADPAAVRPAAVRPAAVRPAAVRPAEVPPAVQPTGAALVIAPAEQP